MNQLVDTYIKDHPIIKEYAMVDGICWTLQVHSGGSFITGYVPLFESGKLSLTQGRSEGSHPPWVNCPAALLNKTPIKCREWRELVYAHHGISPPRHRPSFTPTTMVVGV